MTKIETPFCTDCWQRATCRAPEPVTSLQGNLETPARFTDCYYYLDDESVEAAEIASNSILDDEAMHFGTPEKPAQLVPCASGITGRFIDSKGNVYVEKVVQGENGESGEKRIQLGNIYETSWDYRQRLSALRVIMETQTGGKPIL